MQANATIRKVQTAMLALAILLWAEAGLALVEGDQQMQCSMTMYRGHPMATAEAMPCCPGGHAQTPALAKQRPPCCSVSNPAERPLGFVISSERLKIHPLDLVASVGEGLAPLATRHFAVRRDADAPRFVKSVLELKTDFRI